MTAPLPLTSSKVPSLNARRLMREMVLGFKPREFRTMSEFVEQEIVIPNGPFEGQKYRTRYQPHTSLYFDELDKQRWTNVAVTGPVQGGKTLIGWVVPFMYYMFETRETVICGLPNLDMATDKYKEDLLPIIERTRYRDLIPTKGAGSRGGKPVAVKFKHGPTLRFMSGGGSDKQRSGYTSRVVLITEVDGMDESAGTSDETDKVRQLEGRTGAWGDQKRIHLECTVTTEEGRIWKEYSEGTASRIFCKCVHCGLYVCPEREHLTGWQDAKDELDAKENTCFCCPSCGHLINEDERRKMNHDAKLVHRGQEIDDQGVIHGDLPRTLTLGYRWTAFNNMFVSAGSIGVKEWRAQLAEDADAMERELCQYVHVVPYKGELFDDEKIKPNYITQRTAEGQAKGFVPKDASHLAAFVDVGKYQCHYCVTACRDIPEVGPQLHVVDYGVWDVKSADYDFEQALLIALNELGDFFDEGYPLAGEDGHRKLDKVLVDAGWQGGKEGRHKVIYQYCAKHHAHGRGLFTPAIGRGTAQRSTRKYTKPKAKGKEIALIGENYHIIHDKNERVFRLEVNADYWKRFLHDRLRTPIENAGALTLFDVKHHEHNQFARHLTAESLVTEYDSKQKKVVERYVRDRAQNHYLDAASGSLVALHLSGADMIIKSDRKQPVKNEQEQVQRYGITGPDGNPYSVKLTK